MADKRVAKSRIMGREFTEKEAEWVEKIATKENLDAILKLTKRFPKEKRIACIGHDSPDADCFGVFSAFKDYFFQTGKVEGVDFFATTDGESVLQNQVIEKYLGIDIRDQKFLDENIKLYRKTIFVDTNESHTSLKNLNPDIVFDHHKISEIPVDTCFTIFEDVGASCTMAYLILGEGLGTKFSQETLVGLAWGIALDTRSLQDEGTKEVDMWVHREIISQMDTEHYKTYLHYCYFPPVSFSSIQRRGRAFDGAENENGVVFAFLGETGAPEDNSYGPIVDELMRVKGAEIAVVGGIRNGDFEKISIRVNSETLSHEKVFKDCFKVDFYSSASGISWGGRSTSAGAALIPLTSYERGKCKDPDKKEEFLEDKRRQRINDLQRFIENTSSN